MEHVQDKLNFGDHTFVIVSLEHHKISDKLLVSISNVRRLVKKEYFGENSRIIFSTSP